MTLKPLPGSIALYRADVSWNTSSELSGRARRRKVPQPLAASEKGGQLSKFSGLPYSKFFETRPESGPDCFRCAEFARQWIALSDVLRVPFLRGFVAVLVKTTAEQRGSNLKRFWDFYLKDKAIVWP